MMKRTLCAVFASLAAGMACAASPVRLAPGLTVGSVIHDAVDYENFYDRAEGGRRGRHARGALDGS